MASSPTFFPVLDRLLVAAFVLTIGVPLVGTIAGAGTEANREENRAAAPWPGAPRDLATLAAWPEAFTRYFADHFAYRERLVRWQARIRVGWLSSSPTPDVLLGRNGWLFYGTDGAVEDYTAARPFSETDLEEWRATLEDTRDWLAARGIAYVFVVAPDKHWIYGDEMPPDINGRPGQARVDHLVAHLRARSTVRVVDVREALLQARHDARLYHRTDTHWNDLGAFVAYDQVMRAIDPRLGLRPRTRDQFELKAVRRPGLDLARMLGLGGVLEEEDLQLEPRGGSGFRVLEPTPINTSFMDPRIVTEGPAGAPRALIFRDSFGSAMVPFLSEHFSRAVYAWQNNFDPKLVLDERPAVVIQEWVSRHLYTQTPYDAVAAGRSNQQ